MTNRRELLKRVVAAGTLTAAGAGVISRALAAPGPVGATGTLQDVEHVVVLMQENRSFDHYFGSMRGVRGFDDPRAIALPSGDPVWRQPRPGGGGHVGPFRFDSNTTSAENLESLDHSWKGSHSRWKNHDAWIGAKTPMTMGYFTREDVPFYYALADAFTVCDAYHCSVFGPTSPNRLYLFTGTSGLTVGEAGPLAIRNSYVELNETADPKNDFHAWPGLEWTTYAERLEAAGIRWKVYQEFDNYGDNALAYFKAFRGDAARGPLLEKGRGCVAGSSAENAKTSDGEHLAAAFRRDIETGRLPQVSWIVAPYRLCEHPKASPALGQAFTAQLLAALADNPEVFAKTVFILNYDENDGFFDHVPPPVPPLGAALGASTVDVAGESYGGETVGLGPRVPMIVVSPWTKGGFVNSELFDHTSVLRLIEARFGVHEPNISPWRRAVCGDLTSVFDFAGAGAFRPGDLPATAPLVARAAANLQKAHPAAPEAGPSLPRQEPGQRPARPLPYALHAEGSVEGAGVLRLDLVNAGRAGAALELRAAGVSEGPWFYTVGAGARLSAPVPIGARYDLALRGPNGFLRGFKGAGDAKAGLRVALAYEPAAGRVVLSLSNPSGGAKTVTVKGGGAYDHGPARRREIGAGETVREAWDIAGSAHWYDLVVAEDGDPAFERRFAGHLETGRASLSDPAIGAA